MWSAREKMLEALGVSECCAGSSVIEDAPDFFCWMTRDGGSESLKIRRRIRRVVNTRAAVKTAVDQFAPASSVSGLRDTGRVGGNSCDLKTLQESIDLRGEPGGVARFNDGIP